MTIQFEEKIVLHGSPGVVTTTIGLISREEFAKINPDSAKVAESFAAMLKSTSETHLKLQNPFTLEEREISYDSLVRAFKGLDFDKSMLTYTFDFHPDDPENRPVYVTDVEEDLRKQGWPEERIQELFGRAKGD